MSQASDLAPEVVTERLLAQAYSARRLFILRVIIPGFLIFSLILLVTTGTADVPVLIAQVVVIFAVSLVAFWSTIVERARMATAVLLAGSLLTSIIFIIETTITSGNLDVRTLQSLFLLLLPIIIAGMLGESWLVIMTTGLTFGFSIAIVLLRPLAPDLHAMLQQHQSIALLIVLPLIAQIGAGFFLFAGSSGFRRMQEELVNYRLAYAHEREVDRLREEFIASVNHELRNPVMAVQSYITLADEMGRRGDMTSQHQMLERGGEVATHLADMIESILSVRRLRVAPEDVSLAPVEVLPMARRTARMVTLLDSRGQHRVKVTIPAHIAVAADAALLSETLSNLVSNAVKYSPAQTEIEIAANSLTARQIAHTRPRFETHKDAMYLDVTIRDHGMGIPPEKAAVIFEPFVRLARDEASNTIGTGMGLAICRSNVQAMGGDLWVESSGVSGEGSTFHILLILTDLPEDAMAASGETLKRSAITLNDFSEGIA